MQTLELIEEIQRLPLTKKFYIVEETIRSIKKHETMNQMENVVNELIVEYNSSTKLTEFTSLDFESFYETK